MNSLEAVGLLAAVALGGFMLFALLRLLGEIRPQDYFAISDLISGADFPVTGWAVAYRLAVPVAAGVVAGLVYQISPIVAAAGGGAMGGLLVVWPPVSRPVLLDAHLRKAFRRLLVVYSMFVLSMASLASAGGFLSIWASNLLSSDKVAPTAREIVVGCFSSVLGAGFLAVFNAARKRQSR